MNSYLTTAKVIPCFQLQLKTPEAVADYILVEMLVLEIEGEVKNVALEPPFKALANTEYVLHFFENKTLHIYEHHRMTKYEFVDKEEDLTLN